MLQRGFELSALSAIIEKIVHCIYKIVINFAYQLHRNVNIRSKARKFFYIEIEIRIRNALKCCTICTEQHSTIQYSKAQNSTSI